VTLRAGFIGLGNQGKPLAANLVAAGLETTVYDLADAPLAELAALGARAASSPRDVGTTSDVIGICVPEDEHVRAVLLGDDGVLAGAASGSIIAIHSSILPETATALAAEAGPRGIDVLDACVTGGAARAEQKQMTYLVGGDAEVLSRAQPVFETSAVKVIHAGPLGSGAKLKLCINLLTYIQWAAAYESYHLAKAVGLPEGVFEAAGTSNGQITPLMQSYLGTHKIPEEARTSDAVQTLMLGHTKIAEKDLAWALQLARKAGVSLPVGSLVSQLMARLYGVENSARR